jgi:hypothetical protein
VDDRPIRGESEPLRKVRQRGRCVEVGVGERGGRCEKLGGSRARVRVRVRARVGRVSSLQLVAVKSGGG